MGEHLLKLTPTTVWIINHNKLTLAGLSQLGLNIHTLQQKKKTLYYNYMQMIPKCSYKSTLLLAMQQPKIALCLWLNEVYQIKGLLKLNPLQFISLKSDQ